MIVNDIFNMLEHAYRDHPGVEWEYKRELYVYNSLYSRYGAIQALDDMDILVRKITCYDTPTTP